jgi:hypothetical protein
MNKTKEEKQRVPYGNTSRGCDRTPRIDDGSRANDHEMFETIAKEHVGAYKGLARSYENGKSVTDLCFALFFLNKMQLLMGDKSKAKGEDRKTTVNRFLSSI